MTRVLAALAAFIVAAAAARAQRPPAEAKKLFEAGVQAYEQARYAEAAQAFERAHQLAPGRPRIVFALAQSQRRQYFLDRDAARLFRAADLYREYLRLAPDGDHAREARELLSELGPLAERLRAGTAEPPPASAPAPATMLFLHGRIKRASGRIDGGRLKPLPFADPVTPGSHRIHFEARGYQAADFEVVAVEGELIPVEARLRELAAVLVIEAPPGAGVDVDGRSLGTAPLPGAYAFPPGKHTVTVTQRGRRGWRSEVELVRGGELHLEPSLATTTQRKVAWGFLIGSGTVLLTGALGLTAAANERADARAILDRREQTGSITAGDVAEYSRLRDRSDIVFTGSAALLAIGAAAAITGGLLYWLDTPRLEPPPTRPLVSPTIGEDSLGVRAVLPF